jgi:hypothetical protein
VTFDKYDINIDDQQLTAQQEVSLLQLRRPQLVAAVSVRDTRRQSDRSRRFAVHQPCESASQGFDLEFNYSGIQGRERDAGLAFPRHAARRKLDPDPGLAARRPCRRRRGGPARGRLTKNKFTTYLTYAHGPFSIFLQERYIGGGVNDHTKVESTTRLRSLA